MTTDLHTCELCCRSYSQVRQSLTFGFCCVWCVNKARRLVRRHNRRAKQGGNKGTLFAFDWLSKLYSYGFSCAQCQQKHNLTLDHVRPLSLGGHNLNYNVQPLCSSCHGLKDNKPKRSLR